MPARAHRRILHVTTYLQGGAGDVVCRLAIAQRRQGHAVTVCASRHAAADYGHYPEFLERLADEGIRVVLVDSTFKRELHLVTRGGAELARAIRPWRWDIVHAHAAVPGLVARLALGSGPVRVPVVHTMHGWAEGRDPHHAECDVAVLNEAEAVATCARASRRLLVELGVDAERLHVIRNGVAPAGGEVLSPARELSAALRALLERFVRLPLVPDSCPQSRQARPRCIAFPEGRPRRERVPLLRGTAVARLLSRHASLHAQELARSVQELERRQRSLEARGIRYLVVVAPNKETIYPEFMPERLRPVSDVSRLDQLVAALKERSSVPLLDLRPALRTAKQQGRVYHVTDTHWNDAGSMAASVAVLERLAIWYPQIDRTAAGGEFMTRKGSGGDLARMLALEDRFPEEYVEWRPVRPRAALTSQPAPGSTAPTVHTCESCRGPVVVMTEDSFNENLAPLLAEQFPLLVRVDGFRLVEPLLDRYKPDVVIEQFVERKLMCWQADC